MSAETSSPRWLFVVACDEMIVFGVFLSGFPWEMGENWLHLVDFVACELGRRQGR